eukprot:scaffold10199_cov146-Cylindrotheca_fusiformis.AAC.8
MILSPLLLKQHSTVFACRPLAHVTDHRLQFFWRCVPTQNTKRFPHNLVLTSTKTNLNMAREEERRMLFKQTIANDDGRRRRQETTRQIRKAKKDENLLKRRMEVLPITATNSDDTDTMSGGKKTLQIVADIPGLVASMRNPTATLEQKTDATRDIRRILSAERTPPVEEVLQAGVLPDLIQNLTAIPEAADLIFESAWALTNIASTDWTADVVNAGAVEPLIQLLRHSVPDVREQAGWCIGNIAGEGTTFRDYLLQQGALGPL